MKATIITIGDEILIGQIHDTNATWLSTHLNDIGVQVHERLAVSDSATHITNALDRALAQSNIVLLTGGLGATPDDLTKDVLADYFDSELSFHQEVWDRIDVYLQKRGFPATPPIRDLAMLPEKCEVLVNYKGMAAAMWFDINDKVVVSMPGVPKEMIHFMENTVLPRLQQRFPLPSIYHHNINCAGISESNIADKIKDIETALPPHIKLAYLPNYGTVRLRLSGTAPLAAPLQAEIQALADKIANRLTPTYVFSQQDDTIVKTIGKLLAKKKPNFARPKAAQAVWWQPKLRPNPKPVTFSAVAWSPIPTT